MTAEDMMPEPMAPATETPAATDAAPAPAGDAPAAATAEGKVGGFRLPVRVAAELVGSFLVCFALYVCCSFGIAVYGVNMAFVALITALAYAAVTMMLGGVSGAQVNPAVTVASALLGRTKVLDAVLYVVAQVLGALAAGGLARWLMPTSEQLKVTQWLTTSVNGFGKGSLSYATISSVGIDFGVAMAIAVEVVAGLVIVGTAMAFQGRRELGLAMGAAYGVGAAITFPITGSALNPARATGIALVAQNQGLAQEPLQQLWVFWLAPVLAAALVALAMIVVQMVQEPRAPRQAQAPAADAAPAAVSEGTVDGTADGAAAVAQTPAAAPASSAEQDAAEVGEQQSDAQSDADHGVERD